MLPSPPDCLLYVERPAKAAAADVTRNLNRLKVGLIPGQRDFYAIDRGMRLTGEAPGMHRVPVKWLSENGFADDVSLPDRATIAKDREALACVNPIIQPLVTLAGLVSAEGALLCPPNRRNPQLAELQSEEMVNVYHLHQFPTQLNCELLELWEAEAKRLAAKIKKPGTLVVAAENNLFPTHLLNVSNCPALISKGPGHYIEPSVLTTLRGTNMGSLCLAPLDTRGPVRFGDSLGAFDLQQIGVNRVTSIEGQPACFNLEDAVKATLWGMVEV